MPSKTQSLARLANLPSIGAGGIPYDMLLLLPSLPITVEMFGAKGDATAAGGGTNDAAAFQAAINFAAATGRPIQLLPKVYRISSTLTISNEIRMIGAGTGSDFGTLLLNDSGAAVFFNITVPVGQSIIGMEMAHFTLSTPGTYSGGYGYAECAFYITTAFGYTIHNSWWHNIRVLNHKVGFDFGGVFYQNKFSQIFVTASPKETGAWNGPIAGFRTNAFYDITYNSFHTLEVTNVMNGGYAYNCSSHYSDFTQLTMDGPLYLNGPGCTARNITCEAMTQTASFPQTMVMNFTNFAELKSIIIRDVPTAKFGLGVYVGGSAVDVSGIKVYNSSGNVAGQPGAPIYLDGSGVIRSCRCENFPPASGISDLSGYTALDMDQFTGYGISGQNIRAKTGQLGFYGVSPIAKQTGVAADATALRTALVNLGLIGT